jgi:protein-disulfide isomerase
MSSRSRIRERREQEQRRQRIYWIVGIAVVALIVAAIIILPGLSADEIVAPEPYDWPQGEGATMGDPNAPVHIVEYSDFQCPFCRRFHEETLPQIVETYIRSGQVYFEYRNFPFIGRESVEAANASLCAGEQGMFWTYADYLFANQTGENVGAYTEARLQAIAQEVGLDMDPFEQCSSRNEMQDVVQNQYAQGLEAGVSSTPTFTVNGVSVLGALPFSDFQTRIEAALAE